MLPTIPGAFPVTNYEIGVELNGMAVEIAIHINNELQPRFRFKYTNMDEVLLLQRMLEKGAVIRQSGPQMFTLIGQ